MSLLDLAQEFKEFSFGRRDRDMFLESHRITVKKVAKILSTRMF